MSLIAINTLGKGGSAGPITNEQALAALTLDQRMALGLVSGQEWIQAPDIVQDYGTAADLTLDANGIDAQAQWNRHWGCRFQPSTPDTATQQTTIAGVLLEWTPLAATPEANVDALIAEFNLENPRADLVIAKKGVVGTNVEAYVYSTNQTTFTVSGTTAQWTEDRMYVACWSRETPSLAGPLLTRAAGGLLLSGPTDPIQYRISWGLIFDDGSQDIPLIPFGNPADQGAEASVLAYGGGLWRTGSGGNHQGYLSSNVFGTQTNINDSAVGNGFPYAARTSWSPYIDSGGNIGFYPTQQFTGTAGIINDAGTRTVLAATFLSKANISRCRQVFHVLSRPGTNEQAGYGVLRQIWDTGDGITALVP